jgi:hypothetical protein
MRDLHVRRMRRRPTLFGFTIATLAIAPVPAFAQWGASVVQADSLLASGRVSTAESVYYATSSARPRDAVARAALGRYLASRGALRIGAVLLEEARLFGGDTASIARSLAPIYGSLGDYRALAVLPASPLSPAEQSRARWLVSHAPVLEFPDSVARLPYKPMSDGSGIGTVSVGIGDRAVDAVVDASVSGVVVRGRQARRRSGMRIFGEDSTGVVAVVSELHLGDVVLSNVPARLEADSAHAPQGRRSGTFVGVDVLRRQRSDRSGDRWNALADAARRPGSARSRRWPVGESRLTSERAAALHAPLDSRRQARDDHHSVIALLSHVL